MSNTLLSKMLKSFFEFVTGGLKNINTDHALIHAGYLYFTNLEVASIATSGKKYFLLESPTSLFMHIKSVTASTTSAPIKVRVYRNIGAISTKGTDITANVVKNTNDSSENTNTPDAIFYEDPTPNGGLIETNIWFEIIANGSILAGNRAIGSNNSGQNPNIEWVTDNSRKQYLIEIENTDDTNAAEKIELNFFHYEESKGYITYGQQE